MKRIVVVLGGWALVVCPIVAQLQPGAVDPNQIPAPQPHRQLEYTFDAPMDPSRWATQPTGLRVAFGSTNERYFRSEPPDLKDEPRVWSTSGWRGERLNAQILVWATEAQEQVRLEVSELRNQKGETIARSNLHLRLVRYVISNFPYQAAGFTCDITNTQAYLMPDRLEKFERFNVPARTVRPVWLSIDVPARTEPGDYAGTVEVRSLSGRVALEVQIHVQPLLLPEPRAWKFRLDLWQNPWVLASYFQVSPWSDEHKALLREHLKLYAQAGGKSITTYTTHSPWSDNSYVLEGTMIEWIKTKAGDWRFDYSVFDQYVELAMSAGIDQAITIYTPVPWGYRFRYLDEASGNYLNVSWSPKSEEFRRFWPVFLDDLKAHLVGKGWFARTYLGINENPLDVTLAAAKVIKGHSPDWKITYAGDWHPELASLLDDYSVVMNHEPSLPELRERASKGLTTTFYVCCNPPRPNNFVFSSPAESRFLGWYSAANGYNGFLRWAYDAWPADPSRDARHTLWPAGDCFLVYPGASSSIRFEKLREGIADFEKIRLFREQMADSSNPKAKALMEELEQHLRRLASNRQYEPAQAADALAKGNTLIERLSRELAKESKEEDRGLETGVRRNSGAHRGSRKRTIRETSRTRIVIPPLPLFVPNL